MQESVPSTTVKNILVRKVSTQCVAAARWSQDARFASAIIKETDHNYFDLCTPNDRNLNFGKTLIVISLIEC